MMDVCGDKDSAYLVTIQTEAEWAKTAEESMSSVWSRQEVQESGLSHYHDYHLIHTRIVTCMQAWSHQDECKSLY